MNEFIETICILDGIAQHLEWHQRRIDTTFHFCMPHAQPFSLESALSEYDLPKTGKIKCTLQYESEIQDVIYTAYPNKKIVTLRLMEVPAGFDYRFKYADRRVMEDLYSRKEEADDILMTRHGWITDTSIANIAFRKRDLWYTPYFPLLAGTSWKRLITEKILIPRPIHQSDIPHLDGFKIFNAMNGWEEMEEESIDSIF